MHKRVLSSSTRIINIVRRNCEIVYEQRWRCTVICVKSVGGGGQAHGQHMLQSRLAIVLKLDEFEKKWLMWEHVWFSPVKQDSCRPGWSKNEEKQYSNSWKWKKDGIQQKTGSVFCTTAKWVKGPGARSSGKTPPEVRTYIKQSVFCLDRVWISTPSFVACTRNAKWIHAHCAGAAPRRPCWHFWRLVSVAGMKLL